MTITLDESEIELNDVELKFYLTETQKKKIEKRGVQKFFNNLLNIFNNHS